MHQESGCKIKAACSIEIQDGQTSSMSEYKNQWVLDLVTQGNHWQNTNFRNNAVIFASLDLQFWFGPVLFFLSEFFLSYEMSCLVFSVPGNEAQLRRVHTPSAAGALSSKPCWLWLLEIPVEHLLHNVPFHFVVLAWREPLADRLGGQQSMITPGGKAPQHC